MHQPGNLYIAMSSIHGEGVYTDKTLYPHEIVMIAITHPQQITFFGSKVKHSYTPNCYLSEYMGIYYLVANTTILPHTEITANYNHTPSFIKKAEPHYN